MKLFDTAHKSYQTFQPTQPVKIYVCGITPYDAAHLGHIFTFMTYDLLQRRLEDMGHTVQMVRNITDVDEPIYVKAAELGVSYQALAAQETASFHTVLEQLHFRPLYAEPRASQYIEQMAAAVKQLLDDGFAYYVDHDIYFDTAKAPKFGTFSGYSQRLLTAYMLMRGGDPERLGKRQPFDFLLWCAVTDSTDPAQWSSVVGKGRPGWHIECSVMSEATLGLPFTIHGGGSDLIFPHHESEIAQAYGLHQPQIAQTWVHVAPLLFCGEKMSKSLGNLVFAKDLLATYSSDVIRLALMHYHHRVGGEWITKLLDEAAWLQAGLQKASQHLSLAVVRTALQEIRAALDDDLNTMEVIDSLHRLIAATDMTIVTDKATVPVMNTIMTLLGLVDSLHQADITP